MIIPGFLYTPDYANFRGNLSCDCDG